MFRSDGWRYLQGDLQTDVDMLDNVLAIKDGDELNYRKGVLFTLRNLLGYEDTIRNQRDITEGEQE
jgi:hypothetical protein